MYEDIFKKYKAHVEKVASLYKKTFIQDFEDVLQECYICLIRCAKKYHTDDKSFIKILSKSILNTCYTLYKKDKNKNEISMSNVLDLNQDKAYFSFKQPYSNDTETVIDYIVNHGYKKSQWRVINIKKHFSNLGWSNNKIESCFNEIRDNL
jgi:DNA-directed RNA polymerase specialized sigma24 family protein